MGQMKERQKIATCHFVPALILIFGFLDLREGEEEIEEELHRSLTHSFSLHLKKS